MRGEKGRKRRGEGRRGGRGEESSRGEVGREVLKKRCAK